MENLEVVYKDRKEIIPYANNARTHSETQIKQIAASIKEFGFTNPILIDENDGIIAGHGRLMAAELLDLATVPTITLAGLTDQQRRAYIIADNKLALNAGWEPELLRLELEILSDESFDLELLGFNAEELESLFDATPLGDAEPEQGDTDPSLRVVQFVLRASDFDSFIDMIETIIEAEPQLTDYPSKHGGVIKRAVSYLHERYDV